MMTKKVIALSLGYVLLAALVAGLLYTGVIQIETPSSSEASSICLYHPGTTEYGNTAGATGTSWEGFRVNVTSLVQGSFSSTRRVEVYIAPSEPGVLPNSDYYTYSSGNTTSGRIYVTLAPAYYFFVVTNPSSVPANVTAASCIELTPTP